MSSDITQAIINWQNKEKDAEQYFYLVIYEHLRKLASDNRKRVLEKFGDNAIQEHVNSTTSLVHELYIKLQQQHDEYYSNRNEFFVMVSRAIHNVLVDHARKNNADKRKAVNTSFVEQSEASDIPNNHDKFIELSDAIEQLEKEFPRQAKIVKLKYFGGLLVKEISELVGVSISSIEKDLAFSKSWLKQQLAA